MNIKYFFSIRILGLALLGVSLLFSCQRPSDKPGAITVRQLQDMSEMATVEFVVSRIIRASDTPSWYKYGDRKILMSAGATIKAGIDMGGITDNDINTQGSSITLTLPPASLISLNMHPESIQQEYESRGFFRSPFTNEERYRFLRQAEEEIRESIPEMGLLETAESHAVLFFESWLRLMGYEQVEVRIRK